jgi:hypothetical protein
MDASKNKKEAPKNVLQPIDTKFFHQYNSYPTIFQLSIIPHFDKCQGLFAIADINIAIFALCGKKYKVRVRIKQYKI